MHALSPPSSSRKYVMQCSFETAFLEYTGSGVMNEVRISLVRLLFECIIVLILTNFLLFLIIFNKECGHDLCLVIYEAQKLYACFEEILVVVLWV